MVGYFPGTVRLSLALSLPLRNEDELDELLQELYDPQSPEYQQYLTVEEFTERFGASEADYAAVLRFAETNGLTLTAKAANRMVLDVEPPAANIEKAFHVRLVIYQHPTENRMFYASDREPTVDLEVPLLHVSGIDNFSLPQPKNTMRDVASEKVTGSGPGGSLFGSDVRAAYYVGSGPSTVLDSRSGCLNSALTASAISKRISRMLVSLLTCRLKMCQSMGQVLLKCSGSCNDNEEALDIEQAISMAPGPKRS